MPDLDKSKMDHDSLLDQLRGPVTAENEAALEAAAIALGELGRAAWPALETLLDDADVDRRFWAVRALWANGSQAAIARLIDLLDDPEIMIRSGAALALGELKAALAVPALNRLLREDHGPAGDHAADALAKIGQPAAEPLIAALQDEQALVRIRAAKALTPLESHPAIPALIHCLDHDDSYLVRHYAEVALQRMGVGVMVYFK